MPSILFLNRSYFPDAEATGQFLTELCEDLSERFSVSVIAGQPNANPSGARFRRVGSEVVNGVTVRRVWHTRFSKQSMLGRISNLVSFTLAATLAGLFGRRPDVVVTETDPPLLCLVGRLLAWRFGCKFVVYLQDIHPELGLALRKLRRRRSTRWLRRAFHASYRRADRVVVLSRDMRRYLERTGLSADRIEIIPNWVDTNRIIPVKNNNALRAEWGIGDDDFLVMYSGNLGVCQDLSTILSAAEHLRFPPPPLPLGEGWGEGYPLPPLRSSPLPLGEGQGEGFPSPPPSRIRFLLIGNGVSRQPLQSEVTRRGLTNVHFADYQPLSRLHESLSAADLHLIPVARRAIHYLMPSKLYGILASGTPVIALAPRTSELAEIIEQEKPSAVVPSNDARALADQILRFASNPDRAAYEARARQLAVSRFDRTHSVAAFTNLLNQLSCTRQQVTEDQVTGARCQVSENTEVRHPAAYTFATEVCKQGH